MQTFGTIRKTETLCFVFSFLPTKVILNPGDMLHLAANLDLDVYKIEKEFDIHCKESMEVSAMFMVAVRYPTQIIAAYPIDACDVRAKRFSSKMIRNLFCNLRKQIIEEATK